MVLRRGGLLATHPPSLHNGDEPGQWRAQHMAEKARRTAAYQQRNVYHLFAVRTYALCRPQPKREKQTINGGQMVE